MTAPSNRCPFKVNTATDAGITCENTNCTAYDETNESCIVLEFCKAWIRQNGRDIATIASKINNS